MCFLNSGGGFQYTATNPNLSVAFQPQDLIGHTFPCCRQTTNRKNFEEKFEITFHYHKIMYEEKEGISPDIYIQDSRKAARDKVKETGLPLKMFISYETLCGAVIKRDFVFEKYGFGYSRKMYERIKEMQEKWKDL
jgi:predicted phosphoadenosine phosphosulfate sulfurtransferase